MADNSSYELINTLPSPEEFISALGNWAYVLYICSGLISLILLAQYLVIVCKISIPAERYGPTVWVNSVYAIAAMMCTVAIVLPRAGPYISSVFKIFIGIAMVKFVELLLISVGGEHRILANFNELTYINLKSPPFCFCICCPTGVHMTQKKLSAMKYSVYQVIFFFIGKLKNTFTVVLQMPFVQFLCIFTVDLLGKAEYSSSDDFSLTDENVYLQTGMTMSFFVAMWGLFQLMSITMKFELVGDCKFKFKAVLLKVLIVVINVQGMVIDVLIYYEVFGCFRQLGPKAVGGMVRDVTLMIEAFFLGNLSFYLHF